MTKPGDKIKKVCVIGAGTMGSGIAGQVANAGYPVVLLDIASDGDSRNAVTERALDRLKKSDPPALVHSCLLYTSPSPRDQRGSRMPSSA